MEADDATSLDMLFAVRPAGASPRMRSSSEWAREKTARHLDKLDHGPVGHIMALRESLRLIARPATRPSATGTPSATASIPTIDVRRGAEAS